MEEYLNCWRKYAVFSGRARRKEYWLFFLFNLIISKALQYINELMGVNGEMFIAVVSLIYSLAVIIPSLAVAVRRLHDTNHSGWWYFLVLLPIIGWFILLVWFCTDGTRGTNGYGPDPKGVGDDELTINFSKPDYDLDSNDFGNSKDLQSENPNDVLKNS